jgi:hypothetical protein
MRLADRAIIRSFALLVSTVSFVSCSDDPPPGGNVGQKDASEMILCDEQNPCGNGFTCEGGVCTPIGGTDAGLPDSNVSGARIQVCTPEGCNEPLQMSFGGSRVGASTAQTLTIRSIGNEPVEILNLGLLRQGTEFTVDPSGDVHTILQPNEELAVRVTHIATDGLADREQLQILSNADRARVLVDVYTEYKGVPSLYVGTEPAPSTGEVVTLDFGNIRAGSSESRLVYLKNKDRVIDGSILDIREIRLDPATSSNFTLSTDQTVPVLLNQFNTPCANDNACDTTLGDRCDSVLGVCRMASNGLRDVLTATITFRGTTPGPVEESFVVLSNDGGSANTVRTIVLRANVTFGELEVTPDPIEFVEAFVGYPASRMVTVRNAGNAPLTIQSIALANAGDFSVDLSTLVLPAVLQGNASATFEVVFAPQATGQALNTLVITTDDVAEPVKNVSITGNALIAPELELSTSQLNFGETHVNANATIIVTVRNLGGSDLRIPSLAMSSTTPPQFSVDPVAIAAIAPQQTATFNVRYNPIFPTWPTVQEGALVVTTNDPRWVPDRRARVWGVGVNPNALVVPSGQLNFNNVLPNVNFPNIYYAQEINTQVTVVNSGAGPLQVYSLNIANNNRNAFSIVNAPATPLSIPQGQNLILNVRYAAPSPGGDAADLQILTNDIDLPGSMATVSMLGTTSDCPARANSTGLGNAAGACAYTCAANYWDLNGDRNAVATSNGCEYGPCVQSSPNDAPDDAFLDANCDGIDGTAANAIFVAPAPLGNDVNPGDQFSPKATITGAMATAIALGRSQVYVAAGTFSGPLTLNNGISLYGGYNATAGWSRSAANVTSIVSSTNIGVSASGINVSTIFDRFTVISGNATVPGANSIGIDIANSSSALEIRNSVINSGNGAAGSTGGRGVDGVAGDPGSPGQTGCDGCSNNGNGGGGGFSSCGATGGPGGRGGYGEGNSDGRSGGGGSGGAGGGNLGSAAQGCSNTCCSSPCRGVNGGTGGSGNTGSSGGHGGGGNGAGGVTFGAWVGSSGQNGAAGGAGGSGAGGGGGGGGSSNVDLLFGCGSICNDDRGGGGGGGGAGGCPGTGGIGGTGGGGSFGIFVFNSSPVIAGCTIDAGNGGAGGVGGRYGDGGAGAGGGGIGASQDDSGQGGLGGGGAGGGRGGSGGGGGGGVSYCVYRFNSGSTSLISNNYVAGSGGAGGSGGSLNFSGNGATGASGTVF